MKVAFLADHNVEHSQSLRHNIDPNQFGVGKALAGRGLTLPYGQHEGEPAVFVQENCDFIGNLVTNICSGIDTFD